LRNDKTESPPASSFYADFLDGNEDIGGLLDDLHSSGDALNKRPFPNEIAAYKRSVRRFIGFVVQNGFDVAVSAGIENKYKPLFKRKKGAARDERLHFTNIKIIDEKLESLARAIISGQGAQLSFLSKIHEINGLLVDLLR